MKQHLVREVDRSATLRVPVFGVPLWGLPAWLLWRAYYLSQMPTIGRKLRLFVEWTWGMFFSTDITHLRFTRSYELADPSPRQVINGRINGVVAAAGPPVVFDGRDTG